MNTYMVIETFRHGPDPVYERLNEQGRMLPEGLEYVDSWLTEDRRRCFQLMRAKDRSLFEIWTRHWADLVQFEIIPLGETPIG